MTVAYPYGSLIVTVKEATGTLVKSDPLGKPDPYVRLSFSQDNSVKTDHINGTEIDDPLKDVTVQWASAAPLQLALPRTRTPLRVEIVDHDPIPGTEDDDRMAEGYVDLAPLIPEWAEQVEPEAEYVSEHLRHVTEDAEEGTMVAALTTLDTTQRGTKIEGGLPVSVTMVVKLELPEPGQPRPPRSAEKTRANLAEDMSVLDFACIAMSTTRSLPLRLDDEQVVHPELQQTNLPKMYSPTTKLRTLPSYSMISPRALHSAHSRREDFNRSLASLNASIAYPEPGSTRVLGGPEGKTQINLHRSHSRVSSGGSNGQSPQRTLMCSRAGSPAWTGLDDYTVRTDMATGQTLACGGTYYSSPGALPGFAEDWPCSPSGEPRPAFQLGITGIASPRKRRIATSWLPTPPPRSPRTTSSPPVAAPSPPRSDKSKPTPRMTSLGRGPNGERVWTARMETQHKVSWGRKRDTGRAQRFGLSTGKFDIAEIVKLPPTQVIVGMEKAEWRRMNPAEHAERMAREAKDKEFAEKDRNRKLVAQQAASQ